MTKEIEAAEFTGIVVRIEMLRKLLNREIEKNSGESSLLDKRIYEISVELDELINEYYVNLLN